MNTYARESVCVCVCVCVELVALIFGQGVSELVSRGEKKKTSEFCMTLLKAVAGWMAIWLFLFRGSSGKLVTLLLSLLLKSDLPLLVVWCTSNLPEEWKKKKCVKNYKFNTYCIISHVCVCVCVVPSLLISS